MRQLFQVARMARPASAVTFELGRGEASIIATVRADGRARLRFGTGEEFVGPYDQMPLAVVRGARRLLETAGAWNETGPSEGSVRVTVESSGEVREARRSVAELRDPASSRAPLWGAFTSWLGPFLVVLFGDTPQSGGPESPALARARSIGRSSDRP